MYGGVKNKIPSKHSKYSRSNRKWKIGIVLILTYLFLVFIPYATALQESFIFSDVWRSKIGAEGIYGIAADLDGDMYAESLFYFKNKLYVYGFDGTVSWNKTYSEDVFKTSFLNATPDDDLEVVVCVDYIGTFVYKNDGNLIWQLIRTQSFFDMDVGDVDGDGLDEVVTSYKNKMVSCIKGGTDLWLKFFSTDPIIVKVGDVNGDGKEETIVSTLSKIFVLNDTGEILHSTDIQYPPKVLILADFSGDGVLDIIYGEGVGSTSKIYGLYGNLTRAWSVGVENSVEEILSLNIDNDKKSEILTLTEGPVIYVLEDTGSRLFKLELSVSPSDLGILDPDFDGLSEVAVCLGSKIYFIKLRDLFTYKSFDYSFYTREMPSNVKFVSLYPIESQSIVFVLVGDEGGDIWLLSSDHDGDGLTTIEEVKRFHTNPYNPDTDGDFLKDLDELVIGTDPLNKDTDSDSVIDSIDLVNGFNDILLYIVVSLSVFIVFVFTKKKERAIPP
ncbi:MAG: hypothetical protein ACTSR0_05245 [Candidatus Asgardarchaeia archaeon]